MRIYMRFVFTMLVGLFALSTLTPSEAGTFTLKATATLFEPYGTIPSGDTLTVLFSIDDATGLATSTQISHATKGSLSSTSTPLATNVFNDAFGGTIDAISIGGGPNPAGTLGGIPPGSAIVNHTIIDLRGDTSVLTSTNTPTDVATWNAFTQRTLALPAPSNPDATTAVATIGDFLLVIPITVTNVFHYIRTDSENDVDITPADEDHPRLFFGANAVPNGFANPPTTGVATQGSTTRDLRFDPLSVNLNLFDRTIAYDPGLTGSWTLTFTNGTDQTVRTTPSVGATPAMPFVKNMTISGSGITPTFSWTVPSTAQVDSVRIFIWDVGKRFPGSGQAHADIIHIEACNPSLPTNNTNCNNFSSNATSYTLPSRLSSGLPLEQGNTYSVSINLNRLRNPSAADTSNNTRSQSRSFFDFTPLPADYQTVIGCAATPSCPVYLPTHIHTGAYEFTINDIVAGQTYFVDPPVAIGFDYAIGPGDPNFKSVLLPEAGDNIFDLYLWNGSEYKYHVSVASGFNYTFPTGVDRFRVLGIEASAGLDPNNVTAFITGLTFVSSGQFTGTMTPIVVSELSTADFFLHGNGASANPSNLLLNGNTPTATTATSKDSAGIKLSGGNPWTQIGTWTAQPALSSGTISSLTNLRTWIGLKNSDDQGTRFDLRAEVYKNSTLVATGEIFCVQGVTRNPDQAKEVAVPLKIIGEGGFTDVLASDVLSLKVSTRIGTGAFCSGHSNAVGLRLYFDAVSRPSKFAAIFSE